MSDVDIMEGEAFGAWMIRHVQSSTGKGNIFAGDAGRQRHIRNEFDHWAGRLVAYAMTRALEGTDARDRSYPVSKDAKDEEKPDAQ